MATDETLDRYLDNTVIQDNFVYLAENLPPDDVALQMLSKHLLTSKEHDEYQVKKAREVSHVDRSTYLLQCLKKRKPGYLKSFCAILHDIAPAAHLAEFLEESHRTAVKDREKSTAKAAEEDELQGDGERFILYKYLPEMKQLIDIDNVIIYLLAEDCLPENDLAELKRAKAENHDSGVCKLAQLICHRGERSLERFLRALRKSVESEGNPGHTELLTLLKRERNNHEGAYQPLSGGIQMPVLPGLVESEEIQSVPTSHAPRAGNNQGEATDIKEFELSSETLIPDVMTEREEEGTEVKDEEQMDCICGGILAVIAIILYILLLGGGLTLIVIGCLGLSGEETCDNSDIKELGEHYLFNNPYDVGTPHKLFDVHNLLFGLVCFGAPLIGCSIGAIVGLYQSTHETAQRKCRPIVFCCSVTVGLYILVVLAIPISSFVTISYAYDTLAVLQDIGNDTIVEEVCSPLPLYSALVTSTVLLGGIGLAVLCCFIVPIIFVIYSVIAVITD